MLTTLQRHFIYRPFRAEGISPSIAGLPEDRVRSTQITTHDRLQLQGWHVLPSGFSDGITSQVDSTEEARRLAILFFPGNAAHRGYRTSELELLAGLGAEVFLFDYRGYGDNPGRPSEQHLAADAHAVWKYATEIQGIAPERVVLFGESLGGAVATRLASEMCAAGTSPAGLIVRSTFSTLPDAAAWNFRWFPVRWFMREYYPSVARIAHVTCPLLVVHGARDRIVPLKLGQRLFDAAPDTPARGPEKRLVVLPDAGHNDVHYVAREPYRTAVGEFLDQLRKSSSGQDAE